MTPPARALVSGYYGFANAGDEALLAGLVEGFRQLAPQVELTVLSRDPARTEAEHGVRAVPRGLGSAFAHLRRSDLLISGGGGLLQDATSWRSPLYYLAVMRRARGLDIPVACIGHGIGPLRRGWVKWLARRELSRAAVVAVRDQRSQDRLRRLGLTRDVEVTSDLAFLLPAPTASEISSAWQKSDLASGCQPSMGLALRCPSGGPRTGLVAALAASLDEACRQHGLRPVFVPMQHPRDVAFAEEIAGRVTVPACIVRARLAAREILALTAGFDLVVAMRLHALVFAAISGRPMVAISYDPKVDGLMAELGLEAATSTDAFDGEALRRAIGRVSRLQEMARSLRDQAERLRGAARHNIELVLPLLQGRASR